jgi:acetate kinase
MKILVLNSGSSSQKACIYDLEGSPPLSPPSCLWEGRIEWSGDTAETSVRNASGIVEKREITVTSREQVVRDLLAQSWTGNAQIIGSRSEIDAVGHRVVHGGLRFEDPVVITPEVRQAIASVSEFAPLHIEAELQGVRIVDDLLGGVPQVAVFDTGFHRQMPLSAAIYPGPYEWFESGIRRFGFHGINHRYCAERAAQLVRKDKKALRVVSCHLGNGCSVAAVHGMRSVDTTMGFTPLDGLMMGTRSGAIDPGILTFLMRQGQVEPAGIDAMLNHKSGLLGISGVSGDMRDILAAIARGHERAKLAFDIFVHRLRGAIAAMAAPMGGMDVLVFTAGVGENSAEVRAAVCSGMEFLGIRLDAVINACPTLDADISRVSSQVRVLVIQAEEDWAIAKECWTLFHTAQPAAA